MYARARCQLLHDQQKLTTPRTTEACIRRLITRDSTVRNCYRNGLYKFFGKALAAYRKFLKDHKGYAELLRQENIWKIREKPKLKETSRLVLYLLTNAKSGAERDTARRYARVVDYLYKEGVSSAAAVEYVQNAGGMDQILKKARKGQALKAKVETQQGDDQDFNPEEEPDDADEAASSDATDDLFDAEQDASLRLGSEELERVLSSEIPMNEVFYLECRKTGSVGRDWIRIVGRLYDPESE
jgi:ribosomal protein L17